MDVHIWTSIYVCTYRWAHIGVLIYGRPYMITHIGTHLCKKIPSRIPDILAPICTVIYVRYYMCTPICKLIYGKRICLFIYGRPYRGVHIRVSIYGRSYMDTPI